MTIIGTATVGFLVTAGHAIKTEPTGKEALDHLTVGLVCAVVAIMAWFVFQVPHGKRKIAVAVIVAIIVSAVAILALLTFVVGA